MQELDLQNDTPQISFTGLPAEIITEICQNLCIHCRCERIGELPEDEAAVVIEDQRAIARLSRCARRFKDIAQPVLFHFFHCVEGQIATRRRLPAFVRILVWRPDLAASVRGLALYSPSDSITHLPYKEIKASLTTDDDGTFKRAAKALGPWWEEEGRRPNLQRLQELAIALAHRATYLLLQRTFLGTSSSPWNNWTTWSHPLENLKHVVLVGLRKGWPRPSYSYHLKEAMSFLRHTPKLESLVAADCGGDGDDSHVYGYDGLKARVWDARLANLRKLSLSGENIDSHEVEAIIRHSTVFEDLELFVDASTFTRKGLIMDLDLATATTTLKRLCYSVYPTRPPRWWQRDVTAREEYEETGSDDDDDNDDHVDSFDSNYIMLTGELGCSLRAFTALERLELDQFLLYGRVFEGPRDIERDRSRELVTTSDFLAKLPPSLKHLRLGNIFYWPIVYRDIQVLTEESGRFPNLRSVALEVREAPPREEHDHLVDVYRTAGIALSICWIVKDPFSRGMLPQRPGWPVLLPEPVSYSY